MSQDNININVTENIDNVNIVTSEVVEVVDLNLFPTTEDVTINVTEDIIQVNINKIGASSVTKTSELTNDGEDGTSTYVETDELGAVAFSNDYNDLDNLPTIPEAITKTSDLINDGSDGVNPFITLENVPTVFKISDVNQKPTIPHTGTTALTIISAYLIPAGTLSNNFHLSIRNSMYTKTGTAGALVVRHYISPNETNTVGAVQLSVHSGATGNRHVQPIRDVILRDGIAYSFPLSTTVSDKNVSNATTNISSGALDFTSNDYYFLTVLTLNDATDSAVQQGILVEFIEN